MSKVAVAAKPPELPLNSTGAATVCMLTTIVSAETLFARTDLMGEAIPKVRRGYGAGGPDRLPLLTLPPRVRWVKPLQITPFGDGDQPRRWCARIACVDAVR